MAENPLSQRSVRIGSPERETHDSALQARIREIATTIQRAGADAVVFRCVVFAAETRIDSGGSEKWSRVIDAALAALANHKADSAEFGASHGVMRSLAPSQVASLQSIAVKIDAGVRILATGIDIDGGCVDAVLIASGEMSLPQLQAMLEIGIRAASAECRVEIERATTSHWRSAAAEAAHRADSSIKVLDEISSQLRFVDDAAGYLSAAEPAQRYQRLGSLIAECAQVKTWVVAGVADGRVETLGSSGEIGIENLVRSDSVVQASRSNKIVVCDACVALPIDEVVVLLITPKPLAENVVTRLEGLATRTLGIVRSWKLEAENAEQRVLVHRMGLRLFAAIDEERARIARDLHDDLAQLLTAARIALEGERDQARTILKQVEEDLRHRTRGLRPAALGSASLEEQINHELERLAAAGITGRYVHGPGANRISRPIQQLCYQVTREALSNVIRHAHARSAEVRIDRQPGGARVVISDDGRGMEGRRGSGDGVGLAGVRERVEFLGGRLTIESDDHGTSVIVEIPEPSP